MQDTVPKIDTDAMNWNRSPMRDILKTKTMHTVKKPKPHFTDIFKEYSKVFIAHMNNWDIPQIRVPIDRVGIYQKISL